MMEHAIRCLEYELGRKLAEVDEMSRELNELRRLAAASAGVELPDRRDDIDDVRPPVDVVSAPSPAPAAGSVASPTTGAGPRCGADVLGFSCTRSAGHAGSHVSTGFTSVVPPSDEPTTTGAGDLSESESPDVDETPAHGIERPDVDDVDQADDEFACDLCERTFVKEHGLRMHRIKAHPIDKRPFDPDAARARAAAAA